MSCFGNCCNANDLCEFDGDMSNVCAAPIYVQQVFDAVKLNLQGMKTSNNQVFKPNLPPAHRVKRVIDIRCKKYFNPSNVEDPKNLTLDVDTSISGASFLRDCQGNYLSVVGADGTFSERLLYADTTDCDEKCKGTPIFGTQSISIYGNVIIELDLLLCDNCNNEEIFTVRAHVNIAPKDQPMVLTNFFEICMPSTYDSAFLPRFTEFCNSSCEARLATNNCGRDINVEQGGKITGNLIVAICLSCEKKIVVPVQICVLSSGYVDAPLQKNAICSTFPSLFPQSRRDCEKKKCDCDCDDEDEIENECRPPRRPQPRR